MAKRKVARNSLKGYNYQNYIFTFFLAKMDTEHHIVKIESEALDTKQFDDIYIEMDDGIVYRIQAKNYAGTQIDDIVVSEHTVKIKANENQYDNKDNNVMIINTNQIITDTIFMGLPAVNKSGVIIIPLTEEQVTEYLDDFYQTEERELQIIQKGIEFACAEKFVVRISDLPELITLSTDLQHQTIVLRKVPDCIETGITFYVGKPGVGKSHFVDELKNTFKDSIVYRFWIGPQDEQLRRRLQFDKFLTELGLLVYKTPRSFTVDELIAKMVNGDQIIIIDGLDHVENYNPLELNKYVDFINRLARAQVRVVVLSRPLKTEVEWEKTELFNWSSDEARLYLAMVHDITDYTVQKHILEIAEGYPIITYFLAEHYKKNGKINLNQPVDSLNQYYDNLLENVDTKSLLCIFAANNSFFTWKELFDFLAESGFYDVLKEFVLSHQYLFEIVENRISLLHDSLNTYLRELMPSFKRHQSNVLNFVKSSLADGNYEYMARLASFDLDDDFLDCLLVKYSDFDVFKQLLASTLDYNSITSFYNQLQRILETRENCLNIYQYYSFCLIYQVATRNDLIGCDGLIYQILYYLQKHTSIENHIFSTGIMWNLYLACKQGEDMTKRYIESRNYSDGQFYELVRAVNDEITFYDRLEKKILFEEIEGTLKNTQTDAQKKADLLEEYLISTWIHGNSKEIFHDLFLEYLKTEEKTLFCVALKEYGLDHFGAEFIPHRAKIRLHELGFFGEDNLYRGMTLMEKIKECAPEGSFTVVPVALSVVRLANYENREIDIYSVNYAWTMYGCRKDYSVYNIEDALIIFEEKGLIKETESVELICKLMSQSEKGIRHLISSYINKKGPECTKRLIQAGYFRDNSFKADIFDLLPENINCFSKQYLKSRIGDMLYYGRHSQIVEGRDICYVLESDYCDMVLDALEYYEYSVIGNMEDVIAKKIINRGIKYLGKSEKEEKEYSPFDGGYIHEEDIEYIKENSIAAFEIARYADGWHSCLPFPEIYQLYGEEEMKQNFLFVLHKSMFARVINKEYIGNWFMLLGNIPRFLMICGIEVDWNRLFEIFNQFMNVSLIYLPCQRRELTP
ncbi:hypothetical protein NE619_11395 [Anaerovorax odorimutans]|uniref:NACHT domain-containing protein n=1 Tax=Anaerovorax odorimutans TaxID=109327 RepID=A0ABT1RQ88_9FIRM|nr:hypothetical protein [Anaerovorax odorimutans]MCQ4637328.1 hypothetical protein [Anaerovorax odorimutans]